MISKQKANVVRLTKWSIGLACVLFIVIYFIRNTNEFKSLLDLNVWHLVAIAFLSAADLVIYAARSRTVLRKTSMNVPSFMAWFKIITIGRFFSTFAPQTGNVYKGIYLKLKHNVSYTHYTISFIAFLWLDTLVNLACLLYTSDAADE